DVAARVFVDRFPRTGLGNQPFGDHRHRCGEPDRALTSGDEIPGGVLYKTDRPVRREFAGPERAAGHVGFGNAVDSDTARSGGCVPPSPTVARSAGPVAARGETPCRWRQ